MPCGIANKINITAREVKSKCGLKLFISGRSYTSFVRTEAIKQRRHICVLSERYKTKTVKQKFHRCRRHKQMTVCCIDSPDVYGAG